MRNYLAGVSLAAFARGNRRMLAPLKAKHAEASAEHAEALADLRKLRAKAREIKDPAEKAKALEALKGERPTHPSLVAAGCAVAAAAAGWPLMGGHQAELGAGTATLWVVTALILGQTDPNAEQEADDEDEGQADVESGLEPEPTVPAAAEAHRLTASLTAAGTSVLLTRLAADLAVGHPDWEPSTKAVRALLAEASIPVREGVRTPAGNGPGVHHHDAPKPLPSPEADPALGVVANVGPGRSANANTDNAEEWVGEKGFIMRAHPDDPARTSVVGRTTAA